MNSEIKANLLKEIQDLKKKVDTLEGKKNISIPSYQYSKIRDVDLYNIFDIQRNLDDSVFNEWLNNKIEIDDVTKSFLRQLIEDNKALVEVYGEEDLKANFIIPILNHVKFNLFDKRIRGFYELQMTYKTSAFILSGTIDFAVSEGLVNSRKPYFLIQEFKRSELYGNPRPQLLAELISAVELNDWKFIKGAYIIGGNWHFVILEKLAVGTYQYFVSQNFDSTKITDLQLIYKNLLFVKNEILASAGT